ncbi:MAG: hypothetical protein KJN64_05265 [Ignavibacteria bacterium]|nr:hypothetical protein [Ignavibacteria bacterium]MBT8381685.1 hypothetical protein [Ignavibacteria bacterium]MBT8390306.1 hypothetical protein [Ignavibacteria bacterium]NNJ53073.1 hypothetical protein [Ignavibacteriaceae bacterium]NNL20277.1 hypothetical protein [Ignavibacteriaceae bacterium]
MIKIIIKTLLFVLIFTAVLNGQESTVSSSSGDTVFVMEKSPWGAVLRSAILPGFGQFYNESYWKIPVIWGIGALLVSGWVHNNGLYKENGDLFIQSGNETYRQRRDFYRDQRDNFTIYLVITYLLNLVDAYVDAHLFDFDVEENFGSAAIRMNYRLEF